MTRLNLELMCIYCWWCSGCMQWGQSKDMLRDPRRGCWTTFCRNPSNAWQSKILKTRRFYCSKFSFHSVASVYWEMSAWWLIIKISSEQSAAALEWETENKSNTWSLIHRWEWLVTEVWSINIQTNTNVTISAPLIEDLSVNIMNFLET